MPFFTATADVARILLAGGLNVAEGLIGAGFRGLQLLDRLTRKFTPIGGSPYAFQVYQSVINRAYAALQSGADMMAWQGDLPFPTQYHVGQPGLVSAYEYTTVQRFFNPNTGQEFSFPFRVYSATPLSPRDVIEQAEQMALEWVSADVTVKAGAGGESPAIIGLPRISQALTRI